MVSVLAAIVGACAGTPANAVTGGERGARCERDRSLTLGGSLPERRGAVIAVREPVADARTLGRTDASGDARRARGVLGMDDHHVAAAGRR